MGVWAVTVHSLLEGIMAAEHLVGHFTKGEWCGKRNRSSGSHSVDFRWSIRGSISEAFADWRGKPIKDTSLVDCRSLFRRFGYRGGCFRDVFSAIDTYSDRIRHCKWSTIVGRLIYISISLIVFWQKNAIFCIYLRNPSYYKCCRL